MQQLRKQIVNTKERRRRAEQVVIKLAELREEWEREFSDNIAERSTSNKLIARRERFKILEAEVAIIRLMQSENRLKQQILLAVVSFAGGSLVTYLFEVYFTFL